MMPKKIILKKDMESSGYRTGFEGRLDRSYIIVEKVGQKPKIIEAPVDRRKASALAKKLSGKTWNVAWVADKPYVLYKGGELRMMNVGGKLKRVS